MHARRAIIEAIKSAIGGSSPSHPVYEQEETALEAPCYQLAFGQEEIIYENSTRGALQRRLPFFVTVRASTPTLRDGMCEALEIALLSSVPSGAKTIELLSVELEMPEEGGRRIYPANHAFELLYHTPRLGS
jgi:hypothetical protein